MNHCIFCNFDTNKLENTIIEETKYFYILPAVGSYVEGYLQLVSKRHINAMSELNSEEKEEFLSIIQKYQKLFLKFYGNMPIIFEHGTIDSSLNSASSVSHAHVHLVNHIYLEEEKILKEQNLNLISFGFLPEKEKNYIWYINQNNQSYVSYNFSPTSQLLRIYIARDLGIENEFDWRKSPMYENIEKTIKNFKNLN